MNLFALNLILAVVWAALWGDFGVAHLVTGFHVGFAALWLTQPLYQRRNPYFLRVWRVIRLAGFFVWDLVASSLAVAWDVLTPAHRSRPRIVAMPLDARTDTEILLVTTLISLTPGTLSLDVTPDRETLYLHVMFADDPDRIVRSLKDGIEKMVLEVFR